MKRKVLFVFLVTAILFCNNYAVALAPEEQGAAKDNVEQSITEVFVQVSGFSKGLTKKIIKIVYNRISSIEGFDLLTVEDIVQQTTKDDTRSILQKAFATGASAVLLIKGWREGVSWSMECTFIANGKQSHYWFKRLTTHKQVVGAVEGVVSGLENLYFVHLRSGDVKPLANGVFLTIGLKTHSAKPKKIESEVEKMLQDFGVKQVLTKQDIRKEIDIEEQSDIDKCTTPQCRKAIAAAKGVYDTLSVGRTLNGLVVELDLACGSILRSEIYWHRMSIARKLVKQALQNMLKKVNEVCKGTQ